MEGISYEQNILSAADDSYLSIYDGMGRIWARTRNTVKQTWEYKSLVLTRSAFTSADFSDWFERSGQTIKQLPPPVSMPAKANELGGQGWELVSVTPLSNHSCPDCAGFTSQITYWFKRPK